ncbi:MAG: ATP-binding protein [Anaerolineae bacterium]|nr:ATP-binding protein [Anaerolineae bacterium]
MMIAWNVGYFLGQASRIASQANINLVANGFLQFGSAGVSLSLYVLISNLTRVFPERLKWLALLSILLTAAFNMLTLYTANLNVAPGSRLIYLAFNLLSLFVAWRYRHKAQQVQVLLYLAPVVAGHSLAMLNPSLQSLGLIIANLSTLLASISMTREFLIVPLIESKSKLETMHSVSLVISSQLAPDVVLREIAEGARRWLEADAVALFLSREQFLELVALENLPSVFLKHRVPLKSALAATVAISKRTILLEDYGRQWQQEADLPMARETFGSTICTPLVYHDTVTGVLLVIRGKQSRVFTHEDARQLELFSAQAAVAIANGELFQEQKELDRIKSEMIRMTSHDLKNPLQAALANLDLLRDDLDESVRSNPEVDLSIRAIYKQLDRMTRIISGILDIERARLGVHLNEVCDPIALVHAAFDELANVARDHRVRLVVRAPNNIPSFIGDKAQFQRALVNLVENAIKFSLDGGEVCVVIEWQEGKLLFRVIDEGIGVPDEIADRIFERFFRGQQRGAEHVSGSGLGLSLVKTVVESHHGHIWFEKRPSRGSVFVISLPVSQTNLVKENN